MWENFISQGVTPYSPVTEDDAPAPEDGTPIEEETPAAAPVLADEIVKDPALISQLEQLPEVQNLLKQRLQQAQPVQQAQPAQPANPAQQAQATAAPPEPNQAMAQQNTGQTAINNRNI